MVKIPRRAGRASARSRSAFFAACGLLAAVVICLLAFSDRQRQHAKTDDRSARHITAFDYARDGTIFVSVSSYRDAECAGTVEHMYDMADVPERVHVAVCEQNHEAPGGAEDCTTGHLPLALRQHVQFIRINASLAKGPTLGRALNAGRFNNEDFFLQIDSHTKFAPGWDRTLIRMYQDLRSCVPKPVLSTYPVSTERMDSDAVPRICNASYMDNGLYRFEAAHDSKPDGVFVQTPFAAAGFLFAAGSVMQEVPFDPELPYLFMGEELLYSARLWTHGWDMFSPTINVVYHHYSRERPHSVFGDHDDAGWVGQQRQAHAKALYLLGLQDEKPGPELAANMSRYDMGRKRDVAEYFRFANFDTPDHISRSAIKFCGDAPLQPDSACLQGLAVEHRARGQAMPRKAATARVSVVTDSRRALM